MTFARFFVSGMAMLLMLSSCTTSASSGTTIDDGSSPAAVSVEDLDGTSWTLLFGGSPEGEIAQVEGWPITMNFSGSNLGGTAACNGYGASFRLDDNGFQITELGSEDAGCAPAVQEAERLFQRALEDVNAVNLVGEELALSGPGSELIFRPNTLAPVDDVTATLWLLEATMQDGVETPAIGEPATLLVEPGGLLSGGTGCREINGTFVVSGNEIILNVFSANGQCPTSVRAQDSHVVSVLGDGFVPTVDGDQLVLTSQGNTGLRYRATTEDEVATLPASTAPSDADLLDGVEWIFTGGSGPTGPIVDPRALSDQQITFTVADGMFFGTLNCNAYSGQAQVGSGLWTLGQAASEGESCGPELDAIAASFLEALPLMFEFGFEAGGSRLTTNGSDFELSFERAN